MRNLLQVRPVSDYCLEYGTVRELWLKDFCAVNILEHIEEAYDGIPPHCTSYVIPNGLIQWSDF